MKQKKIPVKSCRLFGPPFALISCFMEDTKWVGWLIFFLWSSLQMTAESTDSLLSPKGVNYEGLPFQITKPIISCISFSALWLLASTFVTWFTIMHCI